MTEHEVLYCLVDFKAGDSVAKTIMDSALTLDTTNIVRWRHELSRLNTITRGDIKQFPVGIIYSPSARLPDDEPEPVHTPEIPHGRKIIIKGDGHAQD